MNTFPTPDPQQHLEFIEFREKLLKFYQEALRIPKEYFEEVTIGGQFGPPGRRLSHASEKQTGTSGDSEKQI